MTKKIFITRPIPDLGISMLEDKGYELTVREETKALTSAEIAALLKDKGYDAVMTMATDPVDSSVYDAAPTVKIFANYAIGFNNFDLDEAKKRGIVITNTPGTTFGNTVAEHALALMLGLTTRMVEADRFMRTGKWDGWYPMHFMGTDLAGKTVGLVGVGQIGERVAWHLTFGFGANVIYYDVAQNEKIEEEYKAQRVGTIEELLERSDIVSLHAPLTDATRHLIDESRLKLMKKTAFLVNTARGAIVDEKALIVALKAGTIKGAGLDVFEFEPDVSSELLSMPNVILTPHIASARESARNEMAKIAAENIIDFFEGRVPRSLVTIK